MKKIPSLINFLNKQGHFCAALGLKKLAAVEVDPVSQQRIEQAAARRSTPFLSWFPEGQRVYLPFKSQIDKGQYAKETFEYLKWYMSDSGHDWSDEDIFNGRRGNEKLNAKWVKRNIIIPYSLEEYNSGILGYFSRFRSSAEFRKYLIDLFNKFLSNTYNPNLTLDHYMGEWDTSLDLEDFSLENTAKINDAKNKIKNIIETIKSIHEELSDFFNDPVRVGSEGDLLVVITIRPDDIATMSTGRRWTSCMNLNEGAHYKDVFCEISDGGFVAYLINESDQDIDDPLARLSIKRFDSADGRSIAVPESDVYSSGEEYPGLIKVVKAWIGEKQGRIHPSTYTRVGGKWSDTFEKEEAFGVDLDMSPERTLEVMRDPVNFFLQNYDFKDTWSVTDNFYNDWWSYFEHDNEDEALHAGEYGYPQPTRLDFLHLEEPKIFQTKEEAEEWIKRNALDNYNLKLSVETDLENWKDREEAKGWGEEVDLSEKDDIIAWVDENERYTIKKEDAMSKVTKVGDDFVNKKGRRIMRSINEKGKYYDYFQENKEDLLWFCGLHTKFQTSRRQLASTFPDTIEYESEDEKIDYLYLSRSFSNIKDESRKTKRGNELKQLLYDAINYDDIVRLFKKQAYSNYPSNYRPTELFFGSLISSLYHSKLVSFRSSFTERLRSVLYTLNANETLLDSDYRTASIKGRVEEVIFDAMSAYQAHDPVALRIYLNEINSLINDFNKKDGDFDAVLDISYKIDNVKGFIYTIRHLRESGSILMPGLEGLYAICKSLYEDSFDYSGTRKTISDNNMKNIVKRKAKETMVDIAILVSKINKQN